LSWLSGGLRVELVLQVAKLAIEIGDEFAQAPHVAAGRQVHEVPQARGSALDESFGRFADADGDADDLRQLLAARRTGERRCDLLLDAADCPA
jgi:hypothetical protein